MLSNISPLGAVKDINIFEKLFDFFKANIKRQLITALLIANCYIKIPILIFLSWRSLHPTTHSPTLAPYTFPQLGSSSQQLQT